MSRKLKHKALGRVLKTGINLLVGTAAIVAVAGQIAASKKRPFNIKGKSVPTGVIASEGQVEAVRSSDSRSSDAQSEDDETAVATSRADLEELAQAAEEAVCNESAANIMVAVSHTPGLSDSGIARGVLESLLPDDEIIVLPKVRRVSGGPIYCILKRGFDIVSCSMALVVLSLPMAAIACLIKKESEGPAIFSQHRLGKNGEVFSLYKFRTMYTSAELKGAQWATEGDPRVTPLGKILRSTRLDELPQFWNVVKGDMSLIGPRPERPIFSEEFARRIDGWDQRLLIRPGVSGLAQVTGGYELLPKEKARYDIEYIESRSLGLDVRIVIRTLITVFKRQGAR